jgi:hypothetical protein
VRFTAEHQLCLAAEPQLCLGDGRIVCLATKRSPSTLCFTRVLASKFDAPRLVLVDGRGTQYVDVERVVARRRAAA